ncbi:hypothetical protein [Hoylesella timonensis]|uniref:Uncharacterized protein n=1 Tax=Hoylesella timonensis S9-PR14 TaxID=1401062 RepID=A0A098YWB0_9BACT|nr:hypothetical protein [Hoylesella timonensis]KGI22888.1 hypothetical protein HMPREF9304_01945 [Hoylesella timonensis S9-PR14]
MEKIKLYIAKAQSNNSDAAKGTAENPYTEEEFETMLDNGTWPGGYVQNMGYVMKEVVVSSSYPDSGVVDSDDSWSWSDPWDSSSDPWDSSSEPWDGTNSSGNSGNNHNGGSQGVDVNSGGHGGGGVISGNKPVSDVIPTSAFKGYRDSDKAGCLNRCREMLATANCELTGSEIAMANYDSNGRATTATDNYKSGLAYIDSQLRQKKPVIVAVDYKEKTSLGSGRKDRAGDHFVIIVGGSQTHGYHYYDPATANIEKGTSSDNTFRLDGKLLKDENRCTGSSNVKYYTLTSIRKNR